MSTLLSPGLQAADWNPWAKKKPDIVTAVCTLDHAEIKLGSSQPLHATVDTTDSLGHRLSYVWSGNGGKISGTGTQVVVDPTGLNAGVYSVVAVAQDAYQHSASCTASFRVLAPPPPDAMSMTCTVVPAVLQSGSTAVLNAQATDALGHALRFRWFANGGRIQGEGSQVIFDSAGAAAGEYSITGRVEDDWGMATDCAMIVKVEPPPPPPPPPPQPSNIAEIVFQLNRNTLGQQAETQLQQVLSRLEGEQEARVSIESYAGPEENNPSRLAGERAEAVKQFLMRNGIAESRVHIMIGLGGRRGGLRNRTLDVIWLPKGLEY